MFRGRPPVAVGGAPCLVGAPRSWGTAPGFWGASCLGGAPLFVCGSPLILGRPPPVCVGQPPAFQEPPCFWGDPLVVCGSPLLLGRPPLRVWEPLFLWGGAPLFVWGTPHAPGDPCLSASSRGRQRQLALPSILSKKRGCGISYGVSQKLPEALGFLTY